MRFSPPARMTRLVAILGCSTLQLIHLAQSKSENIAAQDKLRDG